MIAKELRRPEGYKAPAETIFAVFDRGFGQKADWQL